MSRIADLVAAADDAETVTVDLPKWGVSIDVKSLDGNQRSAFQTALAHADEDEDGHTNVTAIEKNLLVLSCFDPEDGQRCFTEADVEMLWTKNGAYIGKLVAAAMKVSGLSKESEDEVGKGSSASTDEATLSASSTSSSPPPSE